MDLKPLQSLAMCYSSRHTQRESFSQLKKFLSRMRTNENSHLLRFVSKGFNLQTSLFFIFGTKWTRNNDYLSDHKKKKRKRKKDKENRGPLLLHLFHFLHTCSTERISQNPCFLFARSPFLSRNKLSFFKDLCSRNPTCFSFLGNIYDTNFNNRIPSCVTHFPLFKKKKIIGYNWRESSR